MGSLSEKLSRALIGITKIPLSKLARYTFENNLQCMGENFFNIGDIRRALLSLKRLIAKDSYKFMNSQELRTHPHSINAPSPYSPELFPEKYFEEVIQQDDEIGVVFDNAHFRLTHTDYDNKKKWFEPLHSEFLPRVINSYAGVDADYWFYRVEGGKEINRVGRNSFEHADDEKPFQTFINLFNGALRAYSCFVADYNPLYPSGCPSVKLGSSRFLSDGLESFHQGVGKWEGALGDFIQSAEIIEKSISEMRKTGEYESGRDADNETRMMLNHPGLGVVLITDKPQKYHDIFLTNKKLENRWVTLPTTFMFGRKALELMEEDKFITRDFI